MKIDANAAGYASLIQKNTSSAPEIKQTVGQQNIPSQQNRQVKSADMIAHEKNETARTLFYAQTIASAESAEDTEESTAVQEFLDYMHKPTAEKWRERILKRLGLTEEALEAMSAEDRPKIEDKIAEMIEEQIEEDARENNKNGAVQKIETAIDQNSLNSFDLSALDEAELSKLSDNVMQMIDLPEEVENAYKTYLSEDENEEMKKP